MHRREFALFLLYLKMDTHALPLLCILCLITLLQLDGGAAISGGTNDGSERWGYVQVRPSTQRNTRDALPYPTLSSAAVTRLTLIIFLDGPPPSQRRTCSGGTTRARSGRRRRGSHGRPSSGCKAARYTLLFT